MAPPVIQNLRNVPDLSRRRLLRTAQHEVIVLRAVIRRIEIPRALLQICLYNDQMAEIVHTAEQIRIIIRLKMWLKIAVSRTIYFVLVAVDQLSIRMIIQHPHAFIERIRRKEIVVIAKRDEIPGHCPERRICILRNVKLLIVVQRPDHTRMSALLLLLNEPV